LLDSLLQEKQISPKTTHQLREDVGKVGV